MRRYWVGITLLSLAGGLYFLSQTALSGFPVGILTAFAVISLIVGKWGHLTVEEITSRPIWFAAGLIAGVVEIGTLYVWLPKVLTSQMNSFFEAAIGAFVILLTFAITLCAAGVALMRDE